MIISIAFDCVDNRNVVKLLKKEIMHLLEFSMEQLVLQYF